MTIRKVPYLLTFLEFGMRSTMRKIDVMRLVEMIILELSEYYNTVAQFALEGEGGI